MRVSLRWRMGLAIVLVGAATLLATTQFSQRTLNEEFKRFDGVRDTVAVSAAVPILEQYYAGVRKFSWPGADSVLQRVPRERGLQLALISVDGVVRASTFPRLRGAEIGSMTEWDDAGRGPAGPLVFTVTDPPGRRGAPIGMRLMFDRLPARSLHGPDGRHAGHVVSLMVPDASFQAERVRLNRALNRRLWTTLPLAALVSAILLVALSASILSPVEALTRAVRRFGAGDRASRAEVRSSDELGELANAFNTMAASLERSESLRRQMVTDVAHELRTPLTNLRCQIEAMQDGLLAADPVTLRSLHEETLLLARLTDDLHVLTLAEAGQLPLHRQRIALGDGVESAVMAMRARASEAHVTLECAPMPNAVVDADPERLAQVFRNLLANALQHTPRGGRIDVGLALAGDGAVVSVRDTGRGIEAEQQPDVFERFWRADGSRARATGGAGLGLAIVRQLVEAHGGRVSVESRAGEGACFGVWLPLVADPSSALHVRARE